jgi:hypothetical protein
LDNGVIVIMTSNKKQFLSDDEHEALVRPGRIDKVFELTASKYPKAVALYDFTAQQTSDLGFKRGDLISIISQPGNWWQGRINKKEGLIPSNYVKLM